MTQRIKDPGEAVPAPRVFRRARQTPPTLSAAGCYSGRLDNAGVMVGLMMPNVSDAVLADIYKIVQAERRRREAALDG